MDKAKAALLLYGGIAYLAFLGTFLYAIGFLGDFIVPKSIDSRPTAPLPQALAIDLGLLGLFALQHSGMARQGFKRWWRQYIPPPIERSTYVLLSSLVLILIYWQWQSIPVVVWEVTQPAGALVLWALFWLGWGIVLLSSFMIDHLDLFGLRQITLFSRGESYTPPAFMVSAFYRYVRHPLLLGFVIAFWATPRMTLGHLFFALGSTAYILVAIQLEERDLIQFHGKEYRDYRQRVPMLFPFPFLKR